MIRKNSSDQQQSKSKMVLNKSTGMLCLLFIVTINGEVTDEEYDLLPKLFHLEDYDQCMGLRESALYCSITAELAPKDSHSSKIWTIIQKANKNKKNYRHDWLRHGICVPESCPGLSNSSSLYESNKQFLQDRISKCYTDKYNHLGLKATVTKLSCETTEPRHSIDIYDMIIQYFLLLLIAIVIFASFYEGIVICDTKKKNNSMKWTKFEAIFSCFSIPKNWERLRSTNNNPDTERLKFLDGYRFYITVLVIFTHANLLFSSSSIWNSQFIEKLLDDPGNILILNGLYLIQSFFIMSGAMVSYNFLVFFEKHQEFKFKYIVHALVYRYIRLTPCVLVMTTISGTWLYHVNRGPLWEMVVGEEYRNCRANLWTNLLYINNHYNVKNMCMKQSWYLAADTQLFVMSLIIITIMWKYQNHIKLILGICFGIGILITGVINYIYNCDILIRQYPESLYIRLTEVPEMMVMYISGYTNIGACTVGLAYGYFYYTTLKQKCFTNKYVSLASWILIWSLILAIIFIAVPVYKYDLQFSRLQSAIYVGIARNLYSMAVSLGLSALSHGSGGFWYSAFSWTPARILGRLTYSVFLVHYAIICVHIGSMRSPIYMSKYSGLVTTFGLVVMSFMGGLILCLFVELPTTALLKLLFHQPKPNEESEIKKSTIKNIKYK